MTSLRERQYAGTLYIPSRGVPEKCEARNGKAERREVVVESPGYSEIEQKMIRSGRKALEGFRHMICPVWMFVGEVRQQARKRIRPGYLTCLAETVRSGNKLYSLPRVLVWSRRDTRRDQARCAASELISLGWNLEYHQDDSCQVRHIDLPNRAI